MQKAVIVRNAFGRSWSEEADGSAPAQPLADLLADGWMPLRQFALPATEMGGYLLLVTRTSANNTVQPANDMPLSAFNGPIVSLVQGNAEPMWDGESLSLAAFGIHS